MTAYLGGGGSPGDERALWSAMLAGRRRILYWPFALPAGHHEAAARWLREGLAEHGTHEVETWSSPAGRSPGALDGVDLLFVGGGNTYTLLDEIRRAGWLPALRAYVAGGGGYYGGSAGAVLAGADIDVAGACGDPNDVGLTATAGLDLLGGRDLWPHFVPEDAARVRDWSAGTGRPVLAVPERGGLVVAAGAITCAGPDPVRLITTDGQRTLDPAAHVPVA